MFSLPLIKVNVDRNQQINNINKQNYIIYQRAMQQKAMQQKAMQQKAMQQKAIEQTLDISKMNKPKTSNLPPTKTRSNKLVHIDSKIRLDDKIRVL
jgi:hypothetical protein